MIAGVSCHITVTTDVTVRFTFFWLFICFLFVIHSLFIFTHNITNTTSTQTNKTKQQTHTQYFKSPVKRNRESREKKKNQTSNSRRWRNPIPHIKYVSCIRAQEIDPWCKHSNTWGPFNGRIQTILIQLQNI